MPGTDHPAPEHPVRLRVAGLVATALMTGGAYGAGALPGADPNMRLGPDASLSDSWPYWLGLAGWFAGLIILAVTWWRLGAALRRPGARIATALAAGDRCALGVTAAGRTTDGQPGRVRVRLPGCALAGRG